MQQTVMHLLPVAWAPRLPPRPWRLLLATYVVKPKPLVQRLGIGPSPRDRPLEPTSFAQISPWPWQLLPSSSWGKSKAEDE